MVRTSITESATLPGLTLEPKSISRKSLRKSFYSGSSRILVGAEGGLHAQFSAVEEDSNAEVLELAEAFAAELIVWVLLFEAFAGGIGNEVLKVVEDVGQEALSILASSSLEPNRSHRPTCANVQRPLGPAWYSERPDPLKTVLSLPSLSSFQIRFFEEVKALQVSIIKVFFSEEATSAECL